MSTRAYRSLDAVLVERLAELRARREIEAREVAPVREVLVARIGRAAGGAAGTLTGLAMFAAAVAVIGRASEDSAVMPLTALLVAALPLAVATGAVARIVARACSARCYALPPASADVSADLALLEASDPVRDARDAAMRWEWASVALPMTTLSLVAPLTIHAAVYLLPQLSRPPSVAAFARDFGQWIGYSAILVGHAHLALVACSLVWARAIRRCETDTILAGRRWGWGRSLLVTVLVAAMPGILFLGLPPLLVAVTGVLFVPFMFVSMTRRIVTERLAIGV
jgi:hypothetical protein